MASRKEQKEALRREREAREREAHETARRRRLIGYAAGGVLALAAVVAIVVVVAAGGGGGGSDKKSAKTVFPSGGSVPAPRTTDLAVAAKRADCTMKSFKAKSREHSTDINKTIHYSSDPPTSGMHYQEPASDGAYETSPPKQQLVHNLEHGRMIVWVKPSLSKSARADLKAFFDEDNYQMVLTPDSTMHFQVAATAWGADPTPNGTGFLLGCARYGPKVFDALRAFRDKHRGHGPEAVP